LSYKEITAWAAVAAGYLPGIPNPDKPVGAKRKSRFIGELNIDD